MGKYRVLTGTAPFRFGEGLLWILQEYLLFCICCSKIPYTFRPLLITWLSMRWAICFSVPFTLCKAAFPESGMAIFVKAVFTTQLF